jgi:hypothetical protein
MRPAEVQLSGGDSAFLLARSHSHRPRFQVLRARNIPASNTVELRPSPTIASPELSALAVRLPRASIDSTRC